MCVCGGVFTNTYTDRHMHIHANMYKDKLTHRYITRAHTPGVIDVFGGGGGGDNNNSNKSAWKIKEATTTTETVH